jgi:hypothetical protein
MLKFSEAACRVIADDSRVMLSDIGRAYLTSLRMTVNVVETLETSTLAANQSQKVYSRMNAAMAKLVESRSDALWAITQLEAIRGRSNCAPLALGCPAPWVQTGHAIEAQPEAGDAVVG